ncbi:MAG: hypothetical protein V3U60_16450 [Gammaproteobacteria bacterium]
MAEPRNILPTSDRMAINTKALGFTLKADEQTLRDIDEMNERTFKAAQASKKIAWR